MALELEVSDAKALAVQKSFEASTLLAKFEEAQEIISDADIMVNALVKANENAKVQIESHEQKEASLHASLHAEKDCLLNEINSLRALLDIKEQAYELMERKFQSYLLEANELAFELEGGVRHLQTLLSEKLEFVSSDVDWMKSKLRLFTESARTWLEENWLEIIGKDCAISILHLCHMGILLERITGLNAENGFLQRGLCESNSLISMLREHNDKAKNELEMCSVLKGKLLLDINHSFSRIAKKEQEATEFNSRLNSFEKKILHLQAQEEAMLARSNSMYNELSILVEEIDATNRSALAAESREKEELRQQLDEALLLNGIMLKNSILEEFNLPVNNILAVNDLTGCNYFELYRYLSDYRSEQVIINTIAKDIEYHVVASELEQHGVQFYRMTLQIDVLQKQRVRFIKFLDELNMDATLGKIDQELNSIKLHCLSEENSELRIDFENLKLSNTEVVESLHATREENPKLRSVICSLESSIRSLQAEVDGRTKTLMELQCSHADISKEHELKAEIIELGIAREKYLKSENDLLKQELMDIVNKDGSMVERIVNMDVEKLFSTIQCRLEQIYDQAHRHINNQVNMVVNFSKELDIIEVSVEELGAQNSFLQSELIRKDEIAKGLLFDLSLLQELASITKDQVDELNKSNEAIEYLEEELASKSLEVDEVVSERQLLEAQILKSNERVAALEEQLVEKIDTVNIVSTENTELKSQTDHIKGVSCAMEEELAEKSRVTERLEEELIELRNLLDEKNCYLQNLQHDFTKLSDELQCRESEVLTLKEKLERTQALAEESEAIATEARQIAEERKVYAEEKDEEVKLLERSIEELESTVCALENKVDIIKGEAERQSMQREQLEVELQKVRHQMLAVPSSGKAWSSVEDVMIDPNESSRHKKEIHIELLEAQENIRLLQKEVAEKESEIAQCNSHISELNMHAEAAAREYKRKFMELEAMAQQVKTDNAYANANSTKPEKISTKPRGSGSPFKCIGLGFVQQMNSEKEEELAAAKQRIQELEGLAASRQREIFMLNARLAATESMTHDVIRDMLGVKMNMTTWAALVDNQQQMTTNESAISQTDQSKESNELMKLRGQLHEFIEERQSWLDEMNQRQAELGAARITTEKLRQREQFLAAENDMLKAENTNYKNIIINLEDEVKKLTKQQHLQPRINHHIKTKEENILLKKQNEELSAKLQQLGTVVAHTKEELARYRISNGKEPYVQIEEEELLRKKLQESKEDRTELAEKLSTLCVSVMKVAGVRHPESDACLLQAMEAVNILQGRIASLENEVDDLKLKCKLLHEKVRLSELRSESSSLCSRTKEGSKSPSLCSSPSISFFR